MDIFGKFKTWLSGLYLTTLQNSVSILQAYQENPLDISRDTLCSLVSISIMHTAKLGLLTKSEA